MTYIDPGSGSYLLQLIVGTALGVGAALALGFRRTLGRLFRRKNKNSEPQAGPSAPPAANPDNQEG